MKIKKKYLPILLGITLGTTLLFLLNKIFQKAPLSPSQTSSLKNPQTPRASRVLRTPQNASALQKHGKDQTPFNEKNLKSQHNAKPSPDILKVNPLWKQLALQNFLKHRPQGSKVSIKPLGRFIQKNQYGKKQLIEKVAVTSSILDKNTKRTYSFNALVDTNSGKILHTFNRTIHENLSLYKPKWTARPFYSPDSP